MFKVYVSTVLTILLLAGLAYFAMNYEDGGPSRSSWSTSKASPGITNSWLQ